MRTDFLTEEERLYLEEHLEEVILVFRQSCDELKEELKIIYKVNGAFEHSSYNRFLKWSIDTFFTCGYCFYFARIMKTIFTTATFVVEFTGARRVHFLLNYNGTIFDIYKIENEYRWDYKDANSSDLKYARTKFKKMDQELYEKLKYRFYKNIKEYLADKQISTCKRLNK